jgi:hypothetical protein
LKEEDDLEGCSIKGESERWKCETMLLPGVLISTGDVKKLLCGGGTSFEWLEEKI